MESLPVVEVVAVDRAGEDTAVIDSRLGAEMVIAHGARVIRPLFITVALTMALRLAWQAFFG